MGEGEGGEVQHACSIMQAGTRSAAPAQQLLTQYGEQQCRRRCASGDAVVQLAMLAGATTAPGSTLTVIEQGHVWLRSTPWAQGCNSYAQLLLHLLLQCGRPSAFSWGGLVKSDG